MITHNNLKQIRAKAMLSKAELARKAGVSVLTMTMVEQGMDCRMETKRRIIQALGFKITEKDKVFPDKDVGGAVNSQHIYGTAADIATSNCDQWNTLADDAYQKGAWVEGYCSSTPNNRMHVHMDWRGTRSPANTRCGNPCP